MLVITRDENESLVLLKDGEVLAEITVTKCNRSKARIGLTVPENVEVIRKELFDKGVRQVRTRQTTA